MSRFKEGMYVYISNNIPDIERNRMQIPIGIEGQIGVIVDIDPNSHFVCVDIIEDSKHEDLSNCWWIDTEYVHSDFPSCLFKPNEQLIVSNDLQTFKVKKFSQFLLDTNMFLTTDNEKFKYGVKVEGNEHLIF